jgi:hypothetical protein
MRLGLLLTFTLRSKNLWRVARWKSTQLIGIQTDFVWGDEKGRFSRGRPYQTSDALLQESRGDFLIRLLLLSEPKNYRDLKIDF